MNKMTKGALATGLGIALLIGGGGTLAVWNAEATAHAGTIKSGDLKITATGGVWTNAVGDEVDISTYKVVPGDKLTFTQPVTVSLVGDLMEANLTLVDPKKAANYLVVGDITLTDENNVDIKETGLVPSDSGNYTAGVTVELPTDITGRDYVKKTHALGKIGFELTQTPVDSQHAPEQ